MTESQDKHAVCKFLENIKHSSSSSFHMETWYDYKQHFVGRELMCYWIIPNTSKREFSTRDFIIFINKCHTIRILLVHVTFNRKTLRFLSTTINDFYKGFPYIIFLMLQYTNNHTYVRHYYSLTKKLKWQIICCAWN